MTDELRGSVFIYYKKIKKSKRKTENRELDMYALCCVLWLCTCVPLLCVLAAGVVPNCHHDRQRGPHCYL